MKRTVLAALVCLVSAPAIAQWAPLEKGLAYRSVHENQVHLLRVDPSILTVDVLVGTDYRTPILTAEQYRERSGAVIVVNGGFFDDFHHALGLVRRQGKTVNPLRANSWGIFLLEGRRPKIVARKDWRPKGVTAALQVGPRLVVDGRILKFKESVPARRSAVGITKDGLVVIAVSERALYLKEWAEILKKDCVQALNLDGGGSTQLSASASKIKLKIEGFTAVPNAVGVFKK